MDPWTANMFYLAMSPALIFIIARSCLSGFYIAHLVRENFSEPVFNGYRLVKAAAFSYIVATLIASIFAVSNIDAALLSFGIFFGYNILVLATLTAMATDPVGIWYGYSIMGNTIIDAAGSAFD